MTRIGSAVAVLALAVGCGMPPPVTDEDAGLATDGSVVITDSGMVAQDSGSEQLDGSTGDFDASIEDSGVADSGGVDAGTNDSGISVDSGIRDAGAIDAGTRDAGGVDSGIRDAGRADSGIADAGRPDAGGVDAGATSDAGVALVRAMWVWDTTCVTNASKSSALRAFAVSKGINTLYLQIADGPDDSFPANNLMAAQPAALRTFLNAAAADGLSVEFLFGRSKLFLTDFQYNPISLATQARAFVNNPATVSKPTAMHIDIEPHGLRTDTMSQGTTWNWGNAAQRIALLNQLFDLMVAMKTALQGSMELHADVVHWLDTTNSATAINPFTRTLTSGNVTGKNAAQWAVETADGITLMDYSDTASVITSQATAKLGYATTAGNPMVIGVETLGCKTSGGTIMYDPNAGLGSEAETFCNEGNAAMNAAFNTVRQSVTAYPSFAGFAIHHYGSYSDSTAMAP